VSNGIFERFDSDNDIIVLRVDLPFDIFDTMQNCGEVPEVKDES
jgi:hypothetical protein